jgi:hypothetical protein
MNIKYHPFNLNSFIYYHMKIFIINKISFQELNISIDIPDNRKILNKLSFISNLSSLFKLSFLLNKSNN